MAARTVTEKIAVNLKLNNGTSQTGSVKTLTVSMGKISLTGFDVDKAAAVAGLIEACLTNSVYEVQKLEYSQLLAS